MFMLYVLGNNPQKVATCDGIFCLKFCKMPLTNHWHAESYNMEFSALNN